MLRLGLGLLAMKGRGDDMRRRGVRKGREHMPRGGVMLGSQDRQSMA